MWLFSNTVLFKNSYIISEKVRSDEFVIFPVLGSHPECVAGTSEGGQVQMFHLGTLSSAESPPRSHSHCHRTAPLHLSPRYFLHCYNLHHSLSVT